MREDSDVVEIDLNVEKRDRGLKRHSSRRRSRKKKRIHSRVSPRMRSGLGDIERQLKRVVMKQKFIGRNRTYYGRGNVPEVHIGLLEIFRRNFRENSGNLEPRV